MKKRFIPFILAILVLLFYGCNKGLDKIKMPEYSPSLAIPLFEASLKLDNIITPDETIVFQEDSAIHLVFSEDSLFSVLVSELVEIPDQDPVFESYELGQVNIADFSFGSSISLETLSLSMDAATRFYFEAADGTTNPYPPFSRESTTIIDIPPINNFEYGQISSGNLNLTVTNHFPTAFENVHFVLKNENDNTLVFDVNIPSIAALGFVNLSIPLDGKYISNDLIIELLNFTSPGTTNLELIDLSKEVDFLFSSENLMVESGSAILEPQIFSSVSAPINLALDAGYELSQIDLKSALINYSINSTIQIDFLLRINFPNTVSLSTGLPILVEIPISYTGGGAPIAGTIDLSNTSSDFSTTSNVLPLEYELEILSSPNNPVVFNATDKIEVEIELGSIEYSLVKGFFGKTTINFDPEIMDFGADFFEDIEGDFTLTDPIINITYSNSVGLPIAAALQLNGKDKDGNVQALNYLNEAGNDTIYFAYPNVIGENVIDQIQITKETSDIVELLALPPVTLEYGGVVVSNTFGDGSPNFVTDESQIVFGVQMDLPLNLSIANLQFEQSSEIDLGSELEDIDGLFESANILLNIQNGLPFSMDLNLIFMDTITDQEIDNINLSSILAAEVDANGKVSSPTTSKLNIAIDKTKFDNMLLSNSVKISAQVSTSNQGQQSVKLYSNYELKLFLGLQLQIKTD